MFQKNMIKRNSVFIMQ